MAVPPPSEAAKRVRAAFAYAGADTTKEHPALGISKATVARIVSTAKPRGASYEELERIANFTEVPITFFTDGWPDGSPSTTERVEALEHLYATLQTQLGEAENSREALADGLTEANVVLARHTRAIRELRADRRRGGPEAGTG